MVAIVLLCGLTAFTFVLGLNKLTRGTSTHSRIDQVIEYASSDFEADLGGSEKSPLIKRPRRELKWIGQSRSERMELEVLKADLSVTAYEWFLIKWSFPIGITGVLLLVSKNLPGSFLAGLSALIALKLYVKVRVNKREKAFTSQLNDALSIMSNSLRAGYSFLQSVNSVSREMPDPIACEFRRLLKELSLGQDTETALRNLTKRMESEDLELIVRAILIQKETGGNLAEILDTISTTIRDRVKIQGEIRTLTAQGRLSGAIVSIMPFFLIGIMYLINPSYISVLFTSSIGRFMLGFAAINEIIGILLIRKIVRIDM